MNQIFFNNVEADTGIVTFVCAGPHFFIPDNSLLYMETLHKPAIYLWFTALVCFNSLTVAIRGSGYRV